MALQTAYEKITELWETFQLFPLWQLIKVSSRILLFKHELENIL